MLDWLSNDQRASYTEASQILDAPQTPAPLFAYRALKSVLFGSRDDEESDDDDKENIPLQTRSVGASASNEIVFQKPKALTPSRPIPRRMLSPAKSILRTPGLPTPRRQNASVKFKEAKHTPTKPGTIAEASVREEKAVAQPAGQLAAKPMKSETPTKNAEDIATNAPKSGCESLPETYYSVKEIDAYIAATEREMRKLVRYGQRMREYARLSQKENASLARDLEGVRKENEMLRRRACTAVGPGEARQAAGDAGLFDLSPSSRPEAVPAMQADSQGGPRSTARAQSAQIQHQPHKAIERIQPERPPSPHVAKSRTEDNTAAATAKSDTTPPAQPVSTSIPHHVEHPRVASRVQLPPDRLAAAQARLRLKSEGRKKALGLAEQGEKEEHGSSVVDWHDL